MSFPELRAVRFKNASGEPNGLAPNCIYVPDKRRWNVRRKRYEWCVDGKWHPARDFKVICE
jgi:hypothetical protein